MACNADAATIARVAKEDREQANALLLAVHSKLEHRVRKLLGIGTNPDAQYDSAHPNGAKGMQDGMSALFLALKQTNLAIARLILKAGASADLRMGTSKQTVLMVAAANNRLDAATLLLESGADPDVVDKDGGSALHFAAQYGHNAMTRLIVVDHGANVDVQDVDGDTALHRAADRGCLTCVRILLENGAKVDPQDKNGHTPSKDALINNHITTLELFLRHGACPRLAAAPPLLENGRAPSNEEKLHTAAICSAIRRDPRLVHLLADHGGIEDQSRWEFQFACEGDEGAMRALRQVGCDAWCSGGGGVNALRTGHHVDGTQLLGDGLVGHRIEIRLRPSQLVARNDPLDLTIGTRVVLHGLSRADMNGVHGIVAGELGAQKEGRFSVRLRGKAAGVQIKPSNLRPIVDPGRAVVAGHAVDRLQSVVLAGAPDPAKNGVYDLNPTRTANGFPVFTNKADPDAHLFCGNRGVWHVGSTASMAARQSTGGLRSRTRAPSPLGLQWSVVTDDGALTPSDAVAVDTPTWIGDTPPEAWVRRDVMVESYNTVSHEHRVVFCDIARTVRHFRLDHYKFVDWRVLPRRRAAMRAPRTAVALLMVLNRIRYGPLVLDVTQPPLHGGHQILRTMLATLIAKDKEFEYFRDLVWPSVVAPPNLLEVGRVADIVQARILAGGNANAAAAPAPAPARGGAREGGGGGGGGARGGGGGSSKKKKGKKKGKKGRKRR